MAYMIAEHYPPMHMPCGSIAEFDEDSGISYRCTACFAVIGSIGMPKDCKNEQEKYENWKKMGGKGWDYSTGMAE